MAKLHSCNVLNLEAGVSRLWRFHAANGQVALTTERTVPLNQSLPPKLVAKNLRSLWQPKVNISWLPAQKVFLRVLQLPKCDFPELVSMIEFQLEKLSPLPQAQIVWSLELVPHRSNLPSESQTVIVVIAARHFVEEHLGRLESQGYQADRLELPFLHQLLNTKIEGDGVWLYPHLGEGTNLCLAAWWYAGTLQNLGLIHLTSPERWALELDDELKKAAWSGELEGWLTSPPRWHLVADEATARAWEPLLQQRSDAPIEVVPPLDAARLAALNVRRVAREEVKTDLLPEEYRIRYQQQFIDRLWMRGLGAFCALYLVGVLIYMGAVQARRFQLHQIQAQIEKLTPDFEKVKELKARIAVQEQQIGLQYAALDSWKAASAVLPADLTLTSLSFSKGKVLLLQGTVPEQQVEKVTDYRQDLTKFTINGNVLFADVGSVSIKVQPATPRGPAVASWSFPCTLKEGVESE